jgi:hypothetical protein
MENSVIWAELSELVVCLERLPCTIKRYQNTASSCLRTGNNKRFRGQRFGLIQFDLCKESDFWVIESAGESRGRRCLCPRLTLDTDVDIAKSERRRKKECTVLGVILKNASELRRNLQKNVEHASANERERREQTEGRRDRPAPSVNSCYYVALTWDLDRQSLR